MHSSATYSAAAGLTLIFGKTFGFYDNYDRRWSNRIGNDQMGTFDASRAAPTTILSLTACIWNQVWQMRMFRFNILQVSSHWSKSVRLWTFKQHSKTRISIHWNTALDIRNPCFDHRCDWRTWKYPQKREIKEIPPSRRARVERSC